MKASLWPLRRGKKMALIRLTTTLYICHDQRRSLLFASVPPSSPFLQCFFFWNICVCFQMLPPIISTLNLSVCDLKTWFVAVWALHILLKIQARSTRLYSMTTSNEDSETKNSKLSSFDTKSQIWTFSPLILWSLTQNNPEKTILKQKVEHQPSNEVEIEFYLTADLQFANGDC